jgi:hypothetical protein
VEEALLHFEEAARLLPDSSRIQENLELTRRRAQR